jgi:CheY-like chemotaxis protein
MDSKTRILVIDDREPTVRAVKRILEKADYEVSTASDGVTGLQKAVEEKPDLIILDIVMPGIDGYEVCRRLRSDPHTADIAVLMLTGKGRLDCDDAELEEHVQEQIEGYDAGAVEFLTKPIRAKALLDGVKRLLWFDHFVDGMKI